MNSLGPEKVEKPMTQPVSATVRKRGTRRWTAIIVWNLVVLALFVVLAEGAMLALMHYPRLTRALPEGLRFYPLYVYTMFDRQRLYEHYRYDPDLVYTLEPGARFRLSGHEFDVPVETNSAGLRDDEASLKAPAAVVLGDSFTMGWGVAAQATFPELLGELLGMNTLNAGIPSYGTVREVRLFNTRLDKSGLKYLVVQYCENDLAENGKHLYDGVSFRGAGLAPFYQDLNEDRLLTRYYFGKYVYETWSAFARRLQDEKTPALQPMDALAIEYFHLEHARVMLDLLRELKLPDSRTQLVLLHLMDSVDTQYLRDDWHAKDLHFDGALFFQLVQACIAERDYPECIERALLVDPGLQLDKDDYFILDGHINGSGHRKTAEALANAIGAGHHSYLETKLLSAPEGRAAFHVADAPAPLPETAFRSLLSCKQPVLEIPFGASTAYVDLVLENRSDSWWPSSRGDLKGMLRIRPVLLDAEGATVDRSYPNGVTPIPHPVGPGESITVRISLDPGMFPPGVSILEFDLVQEYVAWFGAKGGRTARVQIVRE